MPRIRDRSTSSTVTMIYGNITPGTGVKNPAGTRSGVLHHVDTMTDEVIPHFHRRRSKGEVFVNPMARLKIDQTLSQINITGFQLGENPWGAYSDGFDPDLIPIPGSRLNIGDVNQETARCETVAVTGAYAAVGKPDVDSLVTLGELRETLAFIGSPIRKAVNLTNRVKRHLKTLARDKERYQARLVRYNKLSPQRRSLATAPQLPKRKFKMGKFEATDVSSLWLGYRYGLMPLIYEAQDYWKAFHRKAVSVSRATARATETATLSFSDPTGVHVSTEFGQVYTQNGTINVTIKSRAGVLYEPRIETVQTKYGFELHRVPSALWEMIPLSFVADWVINFSDVIDSLSANLRAQKIMAAWVVTKTTWRYERQRVVSSSRGTGGVSHFTEVGEKTVRSSVSLADVGLTTSVSMNGKRWADALALIHVFLKQAK